LRLPISTPAHSETPCSHTMASNKYVYSWGAGKAEGNKTMKNFLGGKVSAGSS
jgi:hypothetical protein